jgi:large subunit ribosomal protein L30
MAQLKVTQVRSVIGTKRNHRESLRTLGLRKIRQFTVREDTPEVRGLIHAVRHLVTVEEVND